jgi:hypothetical protein
VLDRHRVAFIVIGALAHVIEGADEVTRGVDITPSTKPENLTRLAEALVELGAVDPELETEEPTTVMTSHGELRIVPLPAGTRGYDDLRRGAIREPIGRGLRPALASKGDLAGMLAPPLAATRMRRSVASCAGWSNSSARWEPESTFDAESVIAETTESA